jgi:hypothetical protein
MLGGSQLWENAHHEKKRSPAVAALPAWTWPIDVARYDQSVALTSAEVAALTEHVRNYNAATHEKPANSYSVVERLIEPVEEALAHTALRVRHREFVALFLLREMSRRGRSFWGWTEEEWVETINARRQQQKHIIAIAYLLCSFTRLEVVGGAHLVYVSLARKVFGNERIEAALTRVRAAMAGRGHAPIYLKQYMQRAVCEAFLFNRCPKLEALTPELLRSLKEKRTGRYPAKCMVALSRVLVSLGMLQHPLPIEKPLQEKLGYRSLTEGVPARWARSSWHWFETSTLTRRVRRCTYYFLLSIGRWLVARHPEIASPEQWTRDLAAECVAMVCEMKCGEWAERQDCCNRPVGKMPAPTTRASRLSGLRIFFRLPKPSSRAQLLEARENLLRLTQEIPLREEERAAVEDGAAALEQLSARLIDVPTPSGPTPRELRDSNQRSLPVLTSSIRQVERSSSKGAASRHCQESKASG